MVEQALTLDLDRLYAAVEDDEALGGLPDMLATSCGSRSAMMLYEEAAGTPPIQLASYWPAEHCARYFAEFKERDPWTDLHFRHSSWDGTPIATDEMLPPAAFMRTSIYNELIAPMGDDTARCLGLVLRRGDIRFHIGIHRAARDRPFDGAQLAALATMRDHVTRMLRLRQLLVGERVARNQIEAMAEASGRAILLVDARLRIVRATTAAIAILDADDGLACRAGRLAMWSAAALAELRTMVVATIADRPAARSTILCPRRSAFAPYRVRVLAAGRRVAGRVLLVVDDPARDRTPDVRMYASAYGLTPAECAIAEGLLAGQTLDDVADTRRVTRETVRTQMKSLLARTGTARQSELVRLFATLPHG